MKSFKSLCLCSLMIILTLSGCIEEYDAELPGNESELLVVDGTIQCGYSLFTLSRTQSLNMFEDVEFVDGAEVSIHGSDGSCVYAGILGGGYYFCSIDDLKPDVQYSLHIRDGNDTYETVPQFPLPTEEILEVEGIQNSPEDNIDVLITTEPPAYGSKERFYKWEVYETWEVRPDLISTMYYDAEHDVAVYKLNQYPERGWKDSIRFDGLIGSSSKYEGQQIKRYKIYDIDRSNERIYHLYSGLVRQRAVSREEYEYELARRQASLEMGGLFTPLPSSLPTNIRCTSSSKHVIGYVGCSINTTEARFFLDPKDYSIKHIMRNRIKEIINPTAPLCHNMLARGWVLYGWSKDDFSGTVSSLWASQIDLDVRLQGAYTEMPYFWPGYSDYYNERYGSDYYEENDDSEGN